MTEPNISGSIPAILGGDPIFNQRVPIIKPWVPSLSEMSDELSDVLATGMLTKGKYLTAFEKAAAEHLEVKHAIAVSSCTSGLMLAYYALGLTGDVIAPSFTFMATICSLRWVGLRPIFAEIIPETTNIDPESVEKLITPETSAIVAHHNMGNPADIDAFEEIAKRHNLKLIFDAAHGFGSLYRGKPLGCQGDVQVFSMSPTKLVVAGEGGIVATDDDQLAEKIRIAREYGMGKNYDNLFPGLNARFSEFQAILALHSLKMLPEAVQRRQQIASIFRQELGEIEGIRLPKVDPRDRCSYKDYTICIDPEVLGISRNDFRAALDAENIHILVYYDPPAHQQTAYREFAPKEEEMVLTNQLSANVLSLPIWSNMGDDIATNICRAIQRISRNGPEISKKIAVN